MTENMTELEAENIAILARQVLALIDDCSPASRIQEAYDLLGSACEDYANKLLYKLYSFHNRPELWALGALGAADFARCEALGIDTRLSAAPPETQEFISNYLRERESSFNS
jgi:hypothetical protein